MLFNSFPFLLLFLPVTVSVFFWLGRRSRPAPAAWLGLASLFFYAWWDYRYLPLLLGSIVFNYWCGRRIVQARGAARRHTLVLGIVADLALLGYFKYADFFLSSVNALAGTQWPLLHVLLPIGISFFTFTQIAFLVDAYQGKVDEANFVHYVLFVTYFPHLIAGPVLHHKEMMPQFADPKTSMFSQKWFAIGVTIFVVGLTKKVMIADNLAPHAAAIFDNSAAPSLIVAWGGVLAYTFQLYFDFSGYSDMAVGLSFMFGIRLPLNFDSPYKAVDISDFWRRWHMTLSRFLRDYLYIPLGGNRKGPVRKYANLAITMLLGGLWHGAAWNYVIWGGLHGLYLTVHHLWRDLVNTGRHFPLVRIPSPLTWLATFIAVCFAWVFFRAADLPGAWRLIRGMTGANGIAIPDAIASALHIDAALARLGIGVYLGGGSQFIQTWSWVAFGAAVAWLLPNSQQLVARYVSWDDAATRGGSVTAWAWRPTTRWAAILALLATASLLSLTRPSQFLYFQF